MRGWAEKEEKKRLLLFGKYDHNVLTTRSKQNDKRSTICFVCVYQNRIQRTRFFKKKASDLTTTSLPFAIP